jgi:N-acyl-D-aspartate/D-glutamate deacylase
MLDHLITGGTVVDGTGAPSRPADIAVRDGKIVAVADPGSITEDATHVTDATGMLVIPGVIDPPHPLRRPDPLGRLRLAFQRARRDHGDRW